MTLREKYEITGSNYAETMARLGKEDFLARIIGKFLKDENMNLLKSSLDKGDVKSAFMAVHTIKGIALNLGFTSLAKSSSELTELLRPGSMDGYEPLLAAVEEDYQKIISAFGD